MMDDFDFDSSSGESADEFSNNDKKSSKKPRQKTFSGLSHQSSRSTLNSTTESLLDELDPDEGGLSNVNVVVRIRPLSDQEKRRGDIACITAQAPSTIVVEKNGKTKTFTYNAIFDEDASQQDLLDQCGIKQMIEMTVEGYACTVFAYGQTGSGKTHTITGPTGNDGNMLPNMELAGLIQRSFGHLFSTMNRKSEATFTLYASYLEIYNEQVKDLLNPSSRDSLTVRWSKDRGFYVENLFIVECETQDDLIAVLEEGMRQKQMGTTNINEHSSRSHTIMTLLIDSEMPDQEEQGLYLTKHGKISFVDLAGSEKVKELGSSSELLSETTNINKSLLTLGNCISSLSDTRKRSGHIPYRDSKLTKLLADSLGGNGVTLMVACISPSSYCFAESLSTLRYATRARRIKNKPVVRMDPREKLILSLKREVKLLRAENQYLRDRVDYTGQEQVQMGITKEAPLGSSSETQKDGDGKKAPPLDENKNEESSPEKPAPLNRRETIQSIGKSTADSSMYEMIQEYMLENETLRKENVGLQSGKEQARREQEQLSKENDKLMRKLTHLERVISASPVSLHSVSRTTSGHSIGSQSSDPLSPFKHQTSDPLSPYAQSPNWVPRHHQPQYAQPMQQVPNQGAPSPQNSQSPWAVDFYNYQSRVQIDGQQQGWVPSQIIPVNQWRQMAPGQLPPVDSVKGMPDGYRRLQQRNVPPPPVMQSHPGFPIHQSSVPPPHLASQSLPSNSQGQMVPPPPPMQKGLEPVQRNPVNRPPDISQSFPPPNSLPNQSGSPKPPMKTVQEDGSSWNPQLAQGQGLWNGQASLQNLGYNQGAGTNEVAVSLSGNPVEIAKPTPAAADIYIPPIGKTPADKTLPKEATPPPVTIQKQDLQPIKETGPVKAQGGIKTQPVGNGKGKGPPVLKKTKQQSPQNARGGYASKGKFSQGAGKKVAKKPSQHEADLSSIPRTPSTTPPAIRYVPSGASEMIAASSSDQSRGGPQSNSLKEINHKLREELNALDGEIEYMKYVNKTDTKPALKAGKKR